MSAWKWKIYDPDTGDVDTANYADVTPERVAENYAISRNDGADATLVVYVRNPSGEVYRCRVNVTVEVSARTTVGIVDDPEPHVREAFEETTR